MAQGLASGDTGLLLEARAHFERATADPSLAHLGLYHAAHASQQYGMTVAYSGE